jgi:hypothetical protein
MGLKSKIDVATKKLIKTSSGRPYPFFLKLVGELCNIPLRRNELEPVQHPPKYKLNFKLHQQPLKI